MLKDILAVLLYGFEGYQNLLDVKITWEEHEHGKLYQFQNSYDMLAYVLGNNFISWLLDDLHQIGLQSYWKPKEETADRVSLDATIVVCF